MSSLAIPSTLADASRRFGWIIDLLCRGIGAWSAREPALACLVHARVRRHMRHLQVILARLAAGRFPRAHSTRPHLPQAPAPPPETADPRAPPKPSVRLPRKPGWLMAKDIEVRAAASQLRAWLADPAIRAVLAEVPQARRPLAALCRMLALPPWPHPPDGPPPPAPRRPPRTRPRKPRAVVEPLPPHRSLECDAGLRSATRPWYMPPKNRR